MYFFCADMFVKIEDIEKVWLDEDKNKVFVGLKNGKRKSISNGIGAIKDIQKILKIYELKKYMEDNKIKPTILAKQIGVSAPTICNLVTNKHVSKSLRELLLSHHPQMFSMSEKIF